MRGGEAEQAKRGFGALSPPDSVKATLGSAHLTKDFARIPLTRKNLVEPAERLALSAADGALRIRWADVEWSAPVKLSRGQTLEA
jgi:hypothetical protein